MNPYLRPAATALVFVLAALPSTAGAMNYNDVRARLDVLEGKITRIDKLINSPHIFTTKNELIRKFLNGIYLLKHGKAEDAAGLFLSIVESAPETREGKESLFYLAEASYQSRNYTMARKYYTRTILEGWSRKQKGQSVRRLIEISIKTHDLDAIGDILKLLEKAPDLKDTEEVVYAKGKWAYFLADEELRKPVQQRNVAFALQSFKDAIGHFDALEKRAKGGKFPELYPQAVYYKAVTYIRLKEYDRAVGEFTKLVVDKDLFDVYKGLEAAVKKQGLFVPRNAEDRKITILARLSLARLFVEMGYVGEALKWYRAIPEDDPHYEEALYEMAWVYVQEGRPDLAAQVLGLMAARNRNSIYLPKAKLLLAHLHVRNQEWKKAAKQFAETRGRYMAVYRSLKHVMAEGIDYRVLFRQLAAKKGSGTVGYDLPPEVYPLIRANRTLSLARNVVGDLDTIRKALQESEDALRVIKIRLATGSKVGIFPVLGDLRRETYAIEGAISVLRDRLLERFVKAFMQYLPPQLRSQYQELEKRRQALRKELSLLPKSTDTAKQRQGKLKKAYQRLVMQVDGMLSDLVSFRNFFAGLLKYMNTQMPKEKRARLKPLLMPQFRALQEELEALEEALRELRGRIVDASLGLVTVDDSILSKELQLQAAYLKLFTAQLEIMGSVGSLPAQAASELETIKSLLSRMARLLRHLHDIDAKIYAIAEDKLRTIRSEIKVYEMRISEYKKMYDEYASVSQQLAQAVTDRAFSEVSGEFRKVVVDADMGGVDILWTKNAIVRGKKSAIVRTYNKKMGEVRTAGARVMEIDDSLDTAIPDPFAPRKKAKPKAGKKEPKSAEGGKGKGRKKKARKKRGRR